MARSTERSQRKASGGRYRPHQDKKKSQVAGFAANTKLSPKSKIKVRRTLGGNCKASLLTAHVVNVADQGKVIKTEILNVIENPANPHLVRRNIITRGTVIETKLGKVRVTSRPGQEGSVNGVLIK